MNSSDPYFLVVAGPTGSGKSNLPSKVARALDLPINSFQEPNSKNLLVDDYVEQSDFYKEKVDTIVKAYCNDMPADLDACPSLKTLLDKPTKDIQDKFTDAYFSIWKS